ncbi:hypothetical protein BX600DRAFT_438054 [Xylariales sp. PMI_506]|nr:hypothetical protein BX600DRAFT_438054 [Xylariales sp. PMI_506]
MKFQYFLTFASLAFALPSPTTNNNGLNKRATVGDTVSSAISTLQSAVTSDIAAIDSGKNSRLEPPAYSLMSLLGTYPESAVTTIQNSAAVTVVASATASITANLQDIVNAINTASGTIYGATLGSVGGVAGAILGLSQQEVDQLTAAINEAVTLLTNIQAVVTLAQNVSPAVASAIQSEVTALEAAITPFLTPLEALVTAIQGASVFAGVTVTGLGQAIAGLVSIGQDIINGLF